jgi:hypothetical protein
MRGGTREREEWLTVAQVAAMLRKSRSFVHKSWPKWTEEGLAPVRVGGTPGGRLLFPASGVEKLLSRWRVGAVRRK